MTPAYEYWTQMGLNHKKNRARQSCDTVILNATLPSSMTPPAINSYVHDRNIIGLYDLLTIDE